jgi:23S rRNA pseudouridine1911/1915/1917 synthase
MPTTFPFTAELVVEAYLSGARIDSFLTRHFRNYSPFRMQRIVRAGQVRVNRTIVEGTCRVFRGQQVRVRLIEPPDKLLDPEPLPLEIIYEDPWLVVVNKPAGCVAHPVGEFQAGTLCNALQFHLDRQTVLPGLLRPGIVHRLDRLSSGVIVTTKDHLAHRRLSKAFERRLINKTYLAIVEGELRTSEGTIEQPIGQAPDGGILMSAEPNAKNRKQARTRFDVLARYDQTTLVRAVPLTGRIHQLRVHFASIGHPIVGDDYYDAFGRIRKSPRRGAGAAERHALHALRLTFTHPITNEPLELTAPPPKDFQELLDCAGPPVETTAALRRGPTRTAFATHSAK